jgi:hypothetical protein
MTLTPERRFILIYVPTPQTKKKRATQMLYFLADMHVQALQYIYLMGGTRVEAGEEGFDKKL